MSASHGTAAAGGAQHPAHGAAPASTALSGLARVAARLLDAPLALVARAGEPASRLGGSAGFATVPADGSLPLGALLTDRVLRGGEPVAVPSPGGDLEVRRDLGAGGAGAVAYLGVPVPGANRPRPVAVLAVLDTLPRCWTPEEVATLEELAGMVARELERERLEAESEALATAHCRSEARYRRLMDLVGVGICVIDGAGVVVEANGWGGEAVALPLSEVIGRPFLDFVAPEDRDRARRTFVERLAGEADRQPVELRVVRSTGERRQLQLTVEPTSAVEGTAGLYCVARDVTDERVRETEMRRAGRMASIAPLLSGVCHELNNPLTSIKSFAELLLLDDRPAEDREALEIVRREATRASQIVSDLRVVARQTKEGETGRGVVHVNEVVARVLDLRSGSLAAQEVTVRRELAEGLPAAWGVQTQLEQVVLQLVTNAEQALKSKAGVRRLTVRTYPCELGVGICVQDDGPGIAPEHLDQVFDPFFTTRPAGEGTGLGLSLVHGIVSDHGARIKVESEPGKGAVFTVELPVGRGEPATLAPASAEAGSSSRPLRVLVVDDEAPIRYSLVRYLQRRGHRVDEAADGGAALEILQGQEDGAPGYDIILADLRMPGLTAEALLARLRERGDRLEERLIFITGDADSSDVEHVLRDAGVPVVLKPFELAEIAQIVEVQAGMAMR